MAADQDKEQLGLARELQEPFSDFPKSYPHSHTVDLSPSVRLPNLGSLGNWSRLLC